MHYVRVFACGELLDVRRVRYTLAAENIKHCSRFVRRYKDLIHSTDSTFYRAATASGPVGRCWYSCLYGCSSRLRTRQAIAIGGSIGLASSTQVSPIAHIRRASVMRSSTVPAY